MDSTQLLIVAAAVLGIIVVGFLAIIPAAMELRDLAERGGAKTSVVKALVTASVGRGAKEVPQSRPRVRTSGTHPRTG